METIDTVALENDIKANKADIVILRVSSDNKPTHAALWQLPWDVLHCDNLVYYQCSLSGTIHDLRNELTFVEISEQNQETLRGIVPVIFEDYQNHYFSNPLLDKGKIIEGYIEWAASYGNAQNGKISWLVYRQSEVVAFATCHFDVALSTCEGVLYGVLPNYAGKGIYSDLIRFTQSYFKSQGFKRMLVSTQIQNYSVQKVWAREGFLLKNAYDTYHINSFLGNAVGTVRP